MAYGKQKITGEMPTHYYEADAEWINSMLGYLPSNQRDNMKDERGRVAKAYSKAYKLTLDSEECEVKKINRARYDANTRLRKYIAKKFAIFNKE